MFEKHSWLFNQTPRGANASALLYSLVQTAVANNLEPFDYLKHPISFFINTMKLETVLCQINA
jgi:hypothetical protein